MKKRLAILASAVLIALILFSAFIVLQSYSLSKKPFYVGVTYCGDSLTEAKLLIDKVKNCTNLFVLQSGPLQDNLTATIEICDYATESGLDIIVYYGSLSWKRDVVSAFFNSTENRWGEKFLGLYYGDEPGGNMLDGSQIRLNDEETGFSIWKNKDTISTRKSDETTISFSSSGTITLDTTVIYNGNVEMKPNDPISKTTTYYPNGSIFITLRKLDGSISTLTDCGNISQFETYQELWKSRPLKNYDDASTIFENNSKGTINWLHNQSVTKTFTSDYGLYWFDYLSGYDVVFAEFGWNHTTIQDIALVRGAANMQNKEWGAMLTWKSNEAPYLASGEEMFNQMNLAYDNGAQYVIVFNYSPDNDGVGLLQDEHFEALQRFWNEKVQSSQATCKSSTAEVALVLPRNYGWGMRNPSDTIWGLWQPDDKSTQIWNALQKVLAEYGTKLDIIFDDQNFPVDWHYKQVIYWNKPI